MGRRNGVTRESGNGAGTTLAIAIAIVTATVVVGSGAAFYPTLPGDRPVGSTRGGARFEDGRVLLGFDKWASATQRRAAEAAAGAKEIRRIGAGVHLLRVPPGNVREAIRALRGRPGVAYAEPDYRIRDA